MALAIRGRALAEPPEQLEAPPQVLTVAAISEQTIAVITPHTFVLDGAVDDWRDERPTFRVQSQDASRSGPIWVGESDEGLVVAGSVSSPTPHVATAQDVRARERITVSVATLSTLEVPAIGWGNQFDAVTYASEDECGSDSPRGASAYRRGPKDNEICRAWFRNQIGYREALVRLFTRQWDISNEGVQEGLAVSAYAGLDKKQRKGVELLRPTGVPALAFVPGKQPNQASMFEFRIPWDAMPPTDTLVFDAVYLSVEISPAVETTTPLPPAGVGATVTATFRKIVLPIQREYFITPCRYPLNGMNHRERFKGYFVPASSLDVRRVLYFVNPRHGYQSVADPSAWSPEVGVTTYFANEVGPHEAVCGPQPAHVRNGIISRLQQIPGDCPQMFLVKKLRNEDLLVSTGPQERSSWTGTGQCGACPRETIDLYYVDHSSGRINEAMSYIGISEAEFNYIGIGVSNDWRTIMIEDTSRRQDDFDKWERRSERFCLRQQQRRYIECGKTTEPLSSQEADEIKTVPGVDAYLRRRRHHNN